MNLYDRLDEEIMKGVNAGVRTWNWTTGRTKGDLANILEFSGYALMSSGLLAESPEHILPVTLIVIPSSACCYIGNKNIDDREIKAYEKQCLDPKVEKQKKTLLKYCAPLCSLVGFEFIGLAHSENKDYFGIPFGIGLNLCSAGFYVMRADYLPPRRNVLSRAIDKVKKWAKEFSNEPVTSPAPAYGYNSKNLEGKLI